jgi:hypothetical protein
MPERLEGKVAAILDKHTVVINRGEEQGVKQGDTFYIYAKLGPFKDPESGAELGSTEKTLARVEVDTVEDKFCIASTPRRELSQVTLRALSVLSQGASTRPPLPVAEKEEVPGSSSHLTVKVGSPVFLVPTHKKPERATSDEAKPAAEHDSPS